MGRAERDCGVGWRLKGEDRDEDNGVVAVVKYLVDVIGAVNDARGETGSLEERSLGGRNGGFFRLDPGVDRLPRAAERRITPALQQEELQPRVDARRTT